jgi:hypothetical protein
MTTDPLAAVRAKLAGKHSPATASKSDPLAAVRAQVKTGESLNTRTPAHSTGLLPAQRSTEGRLAALELVVNALASQVPAETKTKLAALAKVDWSKAL